MTTRTGTVLFIIGVTTAAYMFLAADLAAVFGHIAGDWATLKGGHR